jgi:aminopeptidase N
VRAQLGNRRPVAPREPTDSQGIYFGARGRSDSDIYYKGAWVLHTLRWQLGDETFFELLRRFAYPTDEARAATDGSHERFVDTEDLRALAEDLAGRDLARFYELYLRQPELPSLEVERRGERLELAWSAPAGLACLLDVPLEIDGELRRIEVDERGRASVAVHGEVEVDPAGWLLMR